MINIQAQNKFYFSGADELVANRLPELRGKKISLVTNKTAILINGVHLIDALLSDGGIFIYKIFTPEHGFEGNYEAGAEISDSKSKSNNLSFVSLYGKKKKPSPEDLNETDLIIYDIQDLGVRFYTYISTLYYALESATENNIKVLVLDRPDPLSGLNVSGPVLKENELSFIGIQPLPILYGMTPGELALYFNEKIFEKIGKRAEIEIVKLRYWKRSSFLNEYENKWISPSPNIPDFETALVYPGTAFLEGTNVSEGRGTLSPFLQIGAPFIDGKLLADELNEANVDGVRFSAVSFTPESIKGMSEHPKYLGEKCGGIKIEVVDAKIFNPIDFGIRLIKTIEKLFPDKLKFNKHFRKLLGKSFYNRCFKQNFDCEYEKELKEFNKLREKYLLYK